MATVANPYVKYQETAILNAPKEELTLMLYDGGVKFANQALIAIDAKDMPRANDLIIKCENIVRELQLTLNRDYEVSKYFDSMYDWMYDILVRGNMTKDKSLIEEARDLFREFRDMWKEAVKLAKQG